MSFLSEYNSLQFLNKYFQNLIDKWFFFIYFFSFFFFFGFERTQSPPLCINLLEEVKHKVYRVVYDL